MADRLRVMGSQLYWPGIGTTSAIDLLAMASLPHVILQRPRGRAGLESAMDALSDVVAAGV